MKLATTFIPTNRTSNLLCQLFAKYYHGEPTHETLAALRSELGRLEFARFEDDLVRLMDTRSAWRAVARIITAAMERKQLSQITPTPRQIYQRAEV